MTSWRLLILIVLYRPSCKVVARNALRRLVNISLYADSIVISCTIAMTHADLII